MSFTAPAALLALAALPLLWWLLRATPPAPRRESFPAIRLLLGLAAREETPARTPWWLLALRMLAAALIIVGLAGPVREQGSALPGQGPVLLVIDNGWASAADWPRRAMAARAVLDRAARQGRAVALLATAPGADGAAPAIGPPMPAGALRARVAALAPMPWPVDRAAAAAALRGWHDRGGAVVYLADGITDGPAFPRFAAALTEAGPVTEICCAATPPRLLLPPDPHPRAAQGGFARAAHGGFARAAHGGLLVRLAQPPQPLAQSVRVLAQTGDGRTLGEATIAIPAGAATAAAPLDLPAALTNRLARLVLAGPPSAGGVVLLDERWRRRPVGLASADPEAAETPLLGALYYVTRALSPYADLHRGSLAALLKEHLSVIVLADDPLTPGPLAEALARWVDRGGELVRFAGPRTAAAPVGVHDPLLPVRLLGGDRALGGAMSWSRPAGLAPFPPRSPFAGLAVPAEVRVVRQVLARPSAALAGRAWANLADGTPLVTAEARGRGRIVLFHVTANDAWSNLPLSGLFVQMLRRLVALSAGVAPATGTGVLAPWQTLDGAGTLGAPPATALGLAADRFAATAVSPRHPPGLYGPVDARRALNLAGGLGWPVAAPPIAGARRMSFAAEVPELAFGPPLIALAVALLLADLLIALALRGLLARRDGARRVGAAALLPFALLGLGLLAAGPARAREAPAQQAPITQPPMTQAPMTQAPAAGAVPVSGVDPGTGAGLAHSANPALGMRLGYIVTGDPRVDRVSRQGLSGLSRFVNARTAATLDAPDPVVPGQTDLSFYPLLYWPITAGAAPLGPRAAAALNDYMDRGGIVVIDTRDAGSGEGFAPGAAAALRLVARGLVIPPLVPLTIKHVLARTFYLLRSYPGRFAGGTVWVERAADRGNDDVSPVVIGGNDWAAAWATDRDGHPSYAVLPGGDGQRTLAYRFGVNLVMYALTGTYKGDQVQMKAILGRLGR